MRSWLLASLVSLLAGSASAQATWYVDGSACDPPGSGSQTDPFCRIQTAVDAAASGDTVVVRAGVYPEDVLVPAVQLTILGESGADHTELRGPEYLPSFEISPGGNVRIEGFSCSGPGAGLVCNEAVVRIVGCVLHDLTGIRSVGPGLGGGGIWAVDSDVTVSECRFENTLANAGGAIAALRSNLRVEDCEFAGVHGQFSYEGGALWLLDSSTTIARCAFSGFFVFNHGSAIWANRGEIALEDCHFENNLVGDYAGAVAVFDADAAIRGCSFHDNRSSLGWGGALYLSVQPENEVEISLCSFERNEAAEGGAVCVRRGFANLGGCTFRQNVSATSYYFERGHGGGLYVGGFPMDPPGLVSAHASRCVFVENEARGHSSINSGRGGGVFGPVELSNCTLLRNSVGGHAAHDKPAGGAVGGGAILANCIAWENTGENGLDQLEESTRATWSDVQGGWPGQGNLDLDPRFWDRERGDLHLRCSSPCIDGGDPTLLDDDGSRIDMGVYPFDPRYGSRRRVGTTLDGLSAR